MARSERVRPRTTKVHQGRTSPPGAERALHSPPSSKSPGAARRQKTDRAPAWPIDRLAPRAGDMDCAASSLLDNGKGQGVAASRSMEEADEELRACEQEAEAHAAAGRSGDAADFFDRALCLRLRRPGPHHQSLCAAAEALARASNHAASVDLRSAAAGAAAEGGDSDLAVEALSRAEQRLQRTLALLAEVGATGNSISAKSAAAQARGAASKPKPPSPSPVTSALAPCLSLTLGNLAALHQRQGRKEAALICLREAAALSVALPNADAAATHLSLCALLSQLGRHKEAEWHASEAVRLGEADILELPAVGGANALREKVSALAVAYNNLAVQREFLGQVDDCLALYEKAVVLAEGHMDADNPLRARLRESHRNAMQTAAERRAATPPMQQQAHSQGSRGRRPRQGGSTVGLRRYSREGGGLCGGAGRPDGAEATPSIVSAADGGCAAVQQQPQQQQRSQHPLPLLQPCGRPLSAAVKLAERQRNFARERSADCQQPLMSGAGVGQRVVGGEKEILSARTLSKELASLLRPQARPPVNGRAEADGQSPAIAVAWGGSQGSDPELAFGAPGPSSAAVAAAALLCGSDSLGPSAAVTAATLLSAGDCAVPLRRETNSSSSGAPGQQQQRTEPKEGTRRRAVSCGPSSSRRLQGASVGQAAHANHDGLGTSTGSAVVAIGAAAAAAGVAACKASDPSTAVGPGTLGSPCSTSSKRFGHRASAAAPSQEPSAASGSRGPRGHVGGSSGSRSGGVGLPAQASRQAGTSAVADSPPTRSLSCGPQRALQRARREAAAVTIQAAYVEHRTARSAQSSPRCAVDLQISSEQTAAELPRFGGENRHALPDTQAAPELRRHTQEAVSTTVATRERNVAAVESQSNIRADSEKHTRGILEPDTVPEPIRRASSKRPTVDVGCAPSLALPSLSAPSSMGMAGPQPPTQLVPSRPNDAGRQPPAASAPSAVTAVGRQPSSSAGAQNKPMTRDVSAQWSPLLQDAQASSDPMVGPQHPDAGNLPRDVSLHAGARVASTSSQEPAQRADPAVDAARAIQSTWRRRRAEKRWARAVLLQTSLRAHLEQKAVRSRRTGATSLVAILQHSLMSRCGDALVMLRNNSEAKAAAERSMSAKAKAARTIQSVWRRHRAQRRWALATMLQSVLASRREQSLLRRKVSGVSRLFGVLIRSCASTCADTLDAISANLRAKNEFESAEREREERERLEVERQKAKSVGVESDRVVELRGIGAAQEEQESEQQQTRRESDEQEVDEPENEPAQEDLREGSCADAHTETPSVSGDKGDVDCESKTAEPLLKADATLSPDGSQRIAGSTASPVLKGICVASRADQTPAVSDGEAAATLAAAAAASVDERLASDTCPQAHEDSQSPPVLLSSGDAHDAHGASCADTANERSATDAARVNSIESVEPAPPERSSGGADGTVAVDVEIDPWSCLACGFCNEVSPDVCVLCDAPRAEGDNAGGVPSAASAATALSSKEGVGGASTAASGADPPRSRGDNAATASSRGRKTTSRRTAAARGPHAGSGTAASGTRSM